VEQFRKAMEIAPCDAEIYLDMAKALMEKGLKEEAAGYLDQYFILGGK
jgi:Flp pilus assembly protein TadD